jgi:hypothetical protein
MGWLDGRGIKWSNKLASGQSTLCRKAQVDRKVYCLTIMISGLFALCNRTRCDIVVFVRSNCL